MWQYLLKLKKTLIFHRSKTGKMAEGIKLTSRKKVKESKRVFGLQIGVNKGKGRNTESSKKISYVVYHRAM